MPPLDGESTKEKETEKEKKIACHGK